jgi:ParB-like chromosome segregation protein Spo0J
MTDQRFTLAEIRASEIMVTERLVALREEHVIDLAEHIERSRYIQPILIVRMTTQVDGAAYRLIAGRHRTEACRLLGWAIPALVCHEEELEEGEERLLEALENAGRLVLTHAQKVQHEQIILRHYESRLGRSLTREERAARIADAAQRNGIARRTAQVLVQRAEELTPTVLEAVRGTRLDSVNGLELLASMRDDEARLNRIEREKQRESGHRSKQDASRQAAVWIREILDRGLGRQELEQIAQILPLTTLAHLKESLKPGATHG